MVVDFSKIDPREKPQLILKNSSGTPIGVLNFATNISVDIKYNETSVLEFDLPEWVDGVQTPYYDAVNGMRVIDIEEIGQFILVNPGTTGDGVKSVKSCKGYSLEYEFTFKKITLENATYNFWNPVSPDSTLLGAILEKMPSWSIGSVDSTLIGKYRTFEVADTNLYNFIKSTVQQSYNCVFDFDTRNRIINVKDASSHVPTNPIFISNANLAKEIKVTENTENIVTRLDVNGADGVTIRDVNPGGTNTIINLDYFMTPDNFDQSLINKYFDWKAKYESYRKPYYNLSIEYSMRVMCKTTESAKLVELQTELTDLENLQAVTIQAIAQALKTQDDLDEINAQIQSKESEIEAKEEEINDITKSISSIYKELSAINKAVKFDTYFTEEELIILDRYILDDSVSESSFVTQTVNTYDDSNASSEVSNYTVSFLDSDISLVYSATGKEIYDIHGGTAYLITNESFRFPLEVSHATFERSSDNSFIVTIFTGSECATIVGTVSSVVHNLISDPNVSDMLTGTALTVGISKAYQYYTSDTSEYEKRTVAWELYEYGAQILEKVSQPSFTFSVTSANFLCLDDFITFKNSLRHGEKLYVGISDDKILSPICIGVKLDYESPNDLTLEFSDTYTSSDSSFLLADLLDQSVSMGKNVDLSKFTYSAFLDSGASTKVKDFMTSALDVSRNAIISSKNQAISWGDSGIRLRKWTDDKHESYEPHQVWLNNNSIMMTKDNWSSAEIAIGKFADQNAGECWGIVAPNIVGTLLAGENLIIESAKKDGSKSVFRVDADGCVLYNSPLDIVSVNQKTQIALDPQFGIVIGEYPVYTTSVARSSEGTKVVDEDKAKFWVDADGNLYFKGTLRATTGEFTGKVTATSGYIGDGEDGWEIGDTYIFNGKQRLTSAAQGVYIGVDGISLGNGSTYIRATKEGVLTANSAVITGDITATSGKIGGFTISNNAITYNGLSWGGSKSGIYIGPSGIQLGSSFKVDSSGNLYASSGTFSGNVYASNIQYGGSYGTFSGYGLTSGTVSGGSGGKIGSGTISTYNTGSGINTSLGYADFANNVLNGYTRANIFHAEYLHAYSAFSCSGNAYIGGNPLNRKRFAFTDGDGNSVIICAWVWA